VTTGTAAEAEGTQDTQAERWMIPPPSRESPMTPTDFLQLLETVLRQRRVPLSRAAAIAFVESCWELIDDNPDPWF
jgi:hypothetical protein